MKRFIAFDLVKGFAISGVVVFHRLAWDYYLQLDKLPEEIGVTEFLVLLFILMAGIFFLSSGIVNGLSIYRRLTLKRNTVRQILLGGLTVGLVLWGIDYLHNILTVRITDDVVQDVNLTGIIPYFILYGRLPDPVLPTMETFINLGPLSIIGLTVISVTTVLGLYERRIGLDDAQSIRIVLLAIGILIIVLTPVMFVLVGPYGEVLMDQEKYFQAFFIYPVANGAFPIFPYLAYGFFGAFFGIGLMVPENQKKTTLQIGLTAVVLCIIGAFTFQGFETTGFNWENALNNLSLKVLQLGMFCFWIWLAMVLIDNRSEGWQAFSRRLWSGLIPFGQYGLTVYILEATLAVTLQRLISPIWPAWNATLGNTALFGLINLVVWFVILKLWARVDYVGSLEWGMVAVIKTFSGKRSGRLTAKGVGDNSVDEAA